MNHSVKQLVDDFLAWYAGRGQRLKAFLFVGVNRNTCWAGFEVRFFATDDDLAKVLMRQACWQTEGWHVKLAAIVTVGFQSCLFFWFDGVQQALSGDSVVFRIFSLA